MGSNERQDFGYQTDDELLAAELDTEDNTPSSKDINITDDEPVTMFVVVHVNKKNVNVYGPFYSETSADEYGRREGFAEWRTLVLHDRNESRVD